MKQNIWKVISRTTECFLREEKKPPKPDKEKCQRILADLRTIFTLHGLKVENLVRLPERSDKTSAYGRIEATLTRSVAEAVGIVLARLCENNTGGNPPAALPFPAHKQHVVVVVLASTEGVKITCLIRVCASCKRQLIGTSGDASGAPVGKEFLSAHEVTHTFCDECLQKRYPTAWEKIQQARTAQKEENV